MGFSGIELCGLDVVRVFLATLKCLRGAARVGSSYFKSLRNNRCLFSACSLVKKEKDISFIQPRFDYG